MTLLTMLTMLHEIHSHDREWIFTRARNRVSIPRDLLAALDAAKADYDSEDPQESPVCQVDWLVSFDVADLPVELGKAMASARSFVEYRSVQEREPIDLLCDILDAYEPLERPR